MNKKEMSFKSKEKKPFDNKTKTDLKTEDKKNSFKDVEKPKYKVVPLKERKPEEAKPAAAKKAPVKKAPAKKKKK